MTQNMSIHGKYIFRVEQFDYQMSKNISVYGEETPLECNNLIN